MDENKAILRRLHESKPSYKLEQWKKEYRNHSKLVSNICEYPNQISNYLPKLGHRDTETSYSITQNNCEKRSKCIVN